MCLKLAFLIPSTFLASYIGSSHIIPFPFEADISVYSSLIRLIFIFVFFWYRSHSLTTYGLMFLGFLWISRRELWSLGRGSGITGSYCQWSSWSAWVSWCSFWRVAVSIRQKVLSLSSKGSWDSLVISADFLRLCFETLVEMLNWG